VISTRRLRSCVEQWPECDDGLYNPRCCRFPKSCSATIYSDDIDESLLEPVVISTRPEDPAETARWETEKQADQLADYLRRAEKDGKCRNCLEPLASHILQSTPGRPCHVVSLTGQQMLLDWLLPEPPPTDTSWLRMEPIRAASEAWDDAEAAEDAHLTHLAEASLAELAGGARTVPLSAVTRHAYRTSGLAIAITAFVSGALAALGVVAVVAGWHGLGAR
jgi:hypothetical protein